MPLQLAQLGAITKYELLMGWRRRNLLVTALFLFVGLIAFTLMLREEQLGSEAGEILYLDDTVTPATVTMRLYETGEVTTFPADEAVLAKFPHWLRNIDLGWASATLKMATLLGMVTQLLVITLLLMSAETIPLDKHYRVRELLNTLPVGRAIYLCGKLLGMWAGLLLALVLCALIFIPIAQARFGAFDIGAYLRIWGVMLLPAATFASGSATLAAAGVATRRTAVLIGLALIPIGVGVLGLVLYAVYSPFLSASSAAYRALTYDSLIASMLGSIAQTLLFANLGVLALGVVVWIGLRLREGR